MITNSDIEEWFAAIHVSEFDGLEAKHVYEMAEIAYKKGILDAVKKCEQRACGLPSNQSRMARQCAADITSLI